MKAYLEKLDSHLGNIKRAAEAETDPHRSKILWNYLHHGAFETGGDWERIFEPEMIINDPQYQIRDGDEVVQLDGTADVREFYGSLDGENYVFIDDGSHEIFVNDNGLAEFATEIEFKTGERILAEENLDAWYYQDVEIDDHDALYGLKNRHAIFWPYTEDERLIGENIFQISPTEIVKPDADQVPTIAEVEDLVEKYYPENVDSNTPYSAE